jgi:hypothetical protein
MRVMPENLRIIRVITFNPHQWLDGLRQKRKAAGSDPKNKPVENSTQNKQRGIFKRLLLSIWYTINWPDMRGSWMVNAFFVGLYSGLRSRPNAIYSICNPQSNVVTGYLLSVILRVPLVLEYKDAWSVDTNFQQDRPGFLNRLDRVFDSLAIRRASVILGVTPGLVERYKQNYISARSKDWRVVTHGYDEDEIAPYRCPLLSSEMPLRLVYAATRLQVRSYSMEGILNAIAMINKDGVVRIKLDCYGHDTGASALASSLGICDGSVIFHGVVSKSILIKAYQQSDVVCVLLNDTDWNRKKYTSKIFDLIASQRPILACVPPEGMAAGLVKELGIGQVVANEDAEGIGKSMKIFIKQAENGGLDKYYDLSPKLKYERERLVIQLEEAIKKAIGR